MKINKSGLFGVKVPIAFLVWCWLKTVCSLKKILLGVEGRGNSFEKRMSEIHGMEVDFVKFTGGFSSFFSVFLNHVVSDALS